VEDRDGGRIVFGARHLSPAAVNSGRQL